MRKSTLIAAMAFALCAGALTPEAAWAKGKKHAVSYSHDDWTLQSVISQGGDYGGKSKAAYLPGGTSGSQGFSGFGDLNQLLSGACQLGGIGTAIAGFVTGGLGAIPGLIVNGICGVAQISAWASPPPVYNVSIPDKYTTVFVPGLEQPESYQYLLRQPPQVETQNADEIPMVQAPVSPKTDQSTTETVIAPAPKPVKRSPPATAPVQEKVPVKKRDTPEEMAHAPSPITLLRRGDDLRP